MQKKEQNILNMHCNRKQGYNTSHITTKKQKVWENNVENMKYTKQCCWMWRTLWILPDAFEEMGRNGFLKIEGEVL